MTVLLASAAIAHASSPYNPKFAPTATDQKLARSIVLVQDDMPKGKPPWKGGFIKPTTEGNDCLGYREDDLVLTGTASTDFKAGDSAELESDAWVLQTPQMVALDKRRQPGTAAQMKCILSLYTTTKDYTVTVSRLPFPHLGSYTNAWRAVVHFTNPGKGYDTALVDDYVDVFAGRTELSLYLEAGSSQSAAVKPFEVQMAKLLLARATPPKILKYTLTLDDLSPMPGKAYTLNKIMLKPDRVHGEDNSGMLSVLVPPDSITCSATLDAAQLTGSGKGGCRFLIPGDANGEHLLVVAQVTLGDGGTTIRLPLIVGSGPLSTTTTPTTS